MKEIKRLPVLMCSMSRWDSPLSSAAFSLAKELAKSNKVFYFDYPYTLKDYYKGRKNPGVQRRRKALLYGEDIYFPVPGCNGNLIAVTPPVMWPFYFLPPGAIYERVVRINNQRFLRGVARVLKDHNINDYIFFNSFNPFYGQVFSRELRPRLQIYQSRDNIRALPGLTQHGAQMERRCAAQADVILATSSQLVKILEEETGRKVHLLPNAADVSLFESAGKDSYEVPAELKENQKPVVAYIGHIGSRIDFELLLQAAKSHTDKLFLMVGPTEIPVALQKKLKDLPNMLFTGPRPLAQLPQYLQYVDCSIVPFVKNEQTRSIYPLKLNEHLAAGKAMVCTDFSEDVKEFADVVHIASTADEFIAAIEKAVHTYSEEEVLQRVEKVRGNSWSNRVEEFWNIVENTFEYSQPL